MATGNDHPAWEALLAKIPESLHDVVRPVFREWDQGVQQALEAKTQELKKLEGYKQFADNNVDPDWLVEAADFAYRFERDPKEVLTQANKAFDLGFNLDAVPAPSNEYEPPYGDDPEMNNDLTKNPAYAQIMEQLTKLQDEVGGFTSNQEQERQAQEFNQFLGQMHEQHGAFDDNYVTALMANDQTFPQALEAYQTLVAGMVQNEQPGGEPEQGSDGAAVVLGGDSAGSGLPQQPISFGNMKSGDLEDLVAQMLAAGGQETETSP